MVLPQVYIQMFQRRKKCKRLFVAVFGPSNKKKWALFKIVCFRQSPNLAKNNTFQFFLNYSFGSIHGAIQNNKNGLVFFLFLLVIYDSLKPIKTPKMAIFWDFFRQKNSLEIVKMLPNFKKSNNLNEI